MEAQNLHLSVPVYECDYSLLDFVTKARAEELASRLSFWRVKRCKNGTIRMIVRTTRKSSPPVVDRVIGGTRYSFREKLPECARMVWSLRSLDPRDRPAFRQVTDSVAV